MRELKPEEIVRNRELLENILPGDIISYEDGKGHYRLAIDSVNGGKVTGYESKVGFSRQGREKTRTLAALAKKYLSIVSSSDFRKVLPPQ